MSERLKFFKVTIFATDDYRTSPNNPSRQMEVLVPIDAISHLTPRDPSNPQGPYNIHLKKNYPIDAPFPIKTYNPGILMPEQVELLK